MLPGEFAFRFIGSAHLLAALVVTAGSQSIQAGSATWIGDTLSPYWDYAPNWVPETVPDGPNDIATFGVSTQTTVYEDSDATVNSIVFSPGASGFAIWSGYESISSITTIGGAGIVNNSGVRQVFYTPTTSVHVNLYSNTFNFTNAASAGEMTHFYNAGSPNEDYWHGSLKFGQGTTAGSATINNIGGSYAGGETDFSGSSNAGNATITNEAGDQIGGSCDFFGVSSAASATIINEGATVSGGGGGQLYFGEKTDAASSTIICRGSTVSDAYPTIVSFENGSKAGNARIVLFGDGEMSTYYHDTPGITIGSLAGNGVVLLVQCIN